MFRINAKTGFSIILKIAMKIDQRITSKSQRKKRFSNKLSLICTDFFQTNEFEDDRNQSKIQSHL